MPSSRYTTHEKGIAISIDALLAIAVFVAMIAFISTEPASNLPLTQSRIAMDQLVDDAIAAMDNTGFIMESIESAQWNAVGTKLEALLPDNIEYRVEMTRYEAPLGLPDNQCRDAQSFESCFPYDTNTYSLGAELPENKEIFHGKKIFVKKEPGDCSLAELAGKKQSFWEMLFAGTLPPEARDLNITTGDSCPAQIDPCPKTDETMRCCYTYYDADLDPQAGVQYKWYKYNEALSDWEATGETGPTYALGEADDTNRFKCSVRVSDGPNPGDWGPDANSPLAIVGGPCFVFSAEATNMPLECGETTSINFTVSAEAGGREDPVDIMLSMDRSGSMSWIGQCDAAGTERDIFFDSSNDYAYIGTSDYVYKIAVDALTGALAQEIAGEPECYDNDRTTIDDAIGIYVDGTYVYVADSDSGISVIDKSTMAKIRTIGEPGSAPELTTARSVFVEGDYIYAAASGTYLPGTQKINVAGMDSTRNHYDEYIGRYSDSNWAVQSFVPHTADINGVAVELRKYCSPANCSSGPGDLTVHIRESPTGPDLPNGTVVVSAASIPTGAYTWIDVPIPGEAVHVSPNETYYLALTTTKQNPDNYYLWLSRRTWLFDPYNEGEMYLCSNAQTCNSLNSWLSYEDARFRIYTYAVNVGGLVIIDKSSDDIEDWHVVSNLYDTGAGLIDRPQDVFVSGSYAYIADASGGDGTQGLWIVETSDKTNPQKTGFVSTTNPQSVVVSGNYAYVADREGGLLTIDVSNKESPSIVVAATLFSDETVKDIALYDTNIYAIADTGTGSEADGLHVLSISSPASPVELITFDSPYDFYSLDVSADYAFVAMSYGLITIDRLFGPKINFSRNSAKNFVNFEDWQAPEDKLGVASYGNGYSTLNHQLVAATDENKESITNAIGTIKAQGGTPMHLGLEEAIDELLSIRGRADAIQFIILLADGQSDSGTQYSIDTQVARANSNQIYIFAIGIGGDVDNTQMENIVTEAYCPDQAKGDCGSYHHISDPGALNEVYEIISLRIAELAGRIPDSGATDISLSFDNFANGIILENYAPGVLNGTTLSYENLDVRLGWAGSFDATIPCNYVGCGEDFTEGATVEFPPKDTEISFQIDGLEQPVVSWPERFSVETTVYYNDLGLEFIKGKFYAVNDTKLVYGISNEGYQDIDLSAIEPTINFYQGNSSLTACEDPLNDAGSDYFEEILDAAYGESAGPGTSIEAESNVNGSGYICLWVNKNQDVPECAENNRVIINCGIPQAYIYTMDYWAWEK